MMRKLSVICPVYKEEEVIAKFYKELKVTLVDVQNYDHEILFVVDPSPDRTFEILSQIARDDKRVRVLQLSNRFGHQMALLAGMDHCSGDLAIMMDSDLQHPPALIPRLLEKYEQGFDVVYTIREHTEGIFFLRKYLGDMYYKMLNSMSDVDIRQNAADFRLISHRVLTVFRSGLRERNQFIRGLISWIGFRQVAVTFQASERAGGRTKYSLKRVIRFATDGVVSFSKKPLQISIYMGFIFAACGFFLGALTIVQYFMYSYLPSGWATTTVLISFFSGVQLLSVGLLGTYVGAIFDEVKGRPHYIIADVVNPNPAVENANDDDVKSDPDFR